MPPRKQNTPAPRAGKPRVALYIRVSTEEQAITGFGLAVQRDRCRAMAVVKDWSDVVEYADEGISGTKEAADRPGLQALLDAVSQGDVTAVIVLSLDRLGRKTRIVLDLIEHLTKHDVVLVSCKESLDTATPQGQFVLTMFAALAQLERDTIVERTTAGRNARGKQDGEKGGRVPFGYSRTEQGIEVDQAAAVLVRCIFGLKLQGQSLRTIARGLPGSGPQGGNWGPSSVSAVLANEDAYRGGQRGDSSVRWPAIL